MSWSEKHIKDLMAAGKIKGFKPSHTKKPEKYSTKTAKNIPAPKPKAIVWLEWNLQYWCNEQCLTLDREYRFCPDRKYRSDFAIVAHKILMGAVVAMRKFSRCHASIRWGRKERHRSLQNGWISFP